MRRTLPRAVGGFTREGDYFESEHYVLSSAIGHLLELAVPEEYEVKRGKWSFAHLPVIPPRFTLNPIDKTADRLKLLTKLIKRKDVTGLINALRCGTGRRADLPLHRPAREDRQAGAETLAAIDDGRFDPRWLHPPAPGRGDERARRCGDEPRRERLADRHQRHPGDDRLQFKDGAAST